jgi:hypothetical protein
MLRAAFTVVIALVAGASGDTLFAHPSYICVNKAFPGGWLINDPSTFTQKSIDVLLASFNGTRGSDTRKLCVSFDLWSLYGGANTSVILQSVDALLALVDANDLPLSISLDATQWWQGRPDLFNFYDPSQPGYNPLNVNNVEWTAPFSLNATAIAWRNWGSQFRMPSPHPNFASPLYRAAAAASLTPIATHLAAWYDALPPTRKYLLAYVRATQETWIGTNFYYYPNGNALIHANASDDPTGGPAASLQLGYAAVCGGLSERARASTPGCGGSFGSPPEALSPHQLDAVTQSVGGFFAQLMLDAGLPRSKLMTHFGSFFQHAPPCTPFTPTFPFACAVFNTPAAALLPTAFPGWSMYAADSDAAADEGVPEAIGALNGAPWGAPEFNIFSGSHAQWTSALTNLGDYMNNRLVIVQNYESIAGDPVACAAVADFVRADVPCLVDAPAQLSAQKINATAWTLSWTLQLGGCAGGTVAVSVSSMPSTLASGELADADVYRTSAPAAAVGTAVLSLPPGFDAQFVFWGVAAVVAGPPQRMASDAQLLEL